jgi:hypothetical protein
MMNHHPYIQKLVKIFQQLSPRVAHEQAQPLLSQMVSDESFLIEIAKDNLKQPNFLRKTRHYPTLAMQIFENADFHLVANLWPKLPEGEKSRSHQSIHHHGRLLLSTAAAFGPGYETIIFKQGFVTNPQTNETAMSIDRISHHQWGQIDFVDTYQPHLVFYPPDFSITYALWSKDKKSSVDGIKKQKWVQNFKQPLTKIIKSLGLTEFANVNVVENFDFYPEGQKLFLLKDRLTYSNGTNENFLQNIFWGLQKIGFKDFEFLRDLMHNPHITSNAHPWIKRFMAHETIDPKFESAHLFVPRVTLFKDEVLTATQTNKEFHPISQNSEINPPATYLS